MRGTVDHAAALGILGGEAQRLEPRNRRSRRRTSRMAPASPTRCIRRAARCRALPRRRGSPPSRHARSGRSTPRIALRASATISSPSVTTAPTGTSPAAAASAARSSARRIGGGSGKPIGAASGAPRAAVSYACQLLGVVGRRCGLVRPASGPRSAGTFTVVSLVPTLTEPVSTSNAGAWPPLAVTPLRVAAICGACAPRIWLMLRNPVRDRGDDRHHGDDQDEDDGAHRLFPPMRSATLSTTQTAASVAEHRAVRTLTSASPSR